MFFSNLLSLRFINVDFLVGFVDLLSTGFNVISFVDLFFDLSFDLLSLEFNVDFLIGFID